MKIVFPLEIDEDGFPPVSSESLNARRDRHGFILENTPFFAAGVALADRVSGTAVPGVSGHFTFERVIESSSNRALSIIFLDPAIKGAVYQDLKDRGCYCEYGTFGKADELQMLAVSVPETCDYRRLVQYLDDREARRQLSYAELAI